MKDDPVKIDQKEHWESVYCTSSNRFGGEPSSIGTDALALFKEAGARRVLELGCGQGRDTLFLLRNGIGVIGLDYSETCLCHLAERAAHLDLDGFVDLKQHDIRGSIPLPDASVDGCFSHMFFTMELTEFELERIFKEVLRVLRPGGLNIYSVRNVNDPHYRKGIHRGEDMWEMNRFVVHYFSEEKVERLADGYEIVSVDEFEESDLPKRLYRVVLRRPP